MEGKSGANPRNYSKAGAGMQAGAEFAAIARFAAIAALYIVRKMLRQ
jgi:hypothetical protein